MLCSTISLAARHCRLRYWSGDASKVPRGHQTLRRRVAAVRRCVSWQNIETVLVLTGHLQTLAWVQEGAAEFDFRRGAARHRNVVQRCVLPVVNGLDIRYDRRVGGTRTKLGGGDRRVSLYGPSGSGKEGACSRQARWASTRQCDGRSSRNDEPRGWTDRLTCGGQTIRDEER